MCKLQLVKKKKEKKKNKTKIWDARGIVQKDHG